MTNSEKELAKAMTRLANGELNEWEERFVKTLAKYDKKDLRQITYNQYCLLRGLGTGRKGGQL